MAVEPFAAEVTAEDDWKSIAELNSTPGIPVVMLEMLLAADSNDAYLRFQPHRPATGTVGATVADSGSAGTDRTTPAGGYPLQNIWVRNKVAASDATIVVTGSAEVG